MAERSSTKIRQFRQVGLRWRLNLLQVKIPGAGRVPAVIDLPMALRDLEDLERHAVAQRPELQRLEWLLAIEEVIDEAIDRPGLPGGLPGVPVLGREQSLEEGRKIRLGLGQGGGLGAVRDLSAPPTPR